MALINCPECNAQVSDKAMHCPKCGHPINPATDNSAQSGGTFKGKGFIGWMAIAVIMTIVALFALIGTCNWKTV